MSGEGEISSAVYEPFCVDKYMLATEKGPPQIRKTCNMVLIQVCENYRGY